MVLGNMQVSELCEFESDLLREEKNIFILILVNFVRTNIHFIELFRHNMYIYIIKTFFELKKSR